MPPQCRKRKNSTRLLKKTRSKTQSHHDPTIDDVKSNPADNQGIKAQKYDNVCNLLPSYTPWIVSVCTFVIRVYYVTNPASWWVLHPDEVFQSMDVAHSEAYGYGFRPYEFISRPKGDNLSHYQIKETMLEMNALRSPLYPQLMALVAQLFHPFGLADQPFMLWRISHVFVTSGLPLAASLFVKASGQSSDVAALSSILIGTSSHLSVFGTHTIMNSFISPFIFLSLSWLVSLLRFWQGNLEEIDAPLKSTSQYDAHKRNHYDVTNRTALCHLSDLDESSSEITEITTSGRNCQPVQPGELELDPDTAIYLSDKESSSTAKRYVRNSISSDSGYDNRSNSSHTSSNDGHSDEEGIDESGKRYIETLDQDSKYFHSQLASNCLHEIIRDPYHDSHFNKNDILNHGSRSLAFDFIAGFLLGTSLYSRPDSCLFVAVVVLANIDFKVHFFMSIMKSGSSWIFVSGAFVSILLGIGDDLYFYQDFSISPLQWFRFNVLSTLASEFFGTSGAFFYVSNVFHGNAGVATLSVLFMSFITFSFLALSIITFSGDASKKLFRTTCGRNDVDNVSNPRLSLGKIHKYTALLVISAKNSRYICPAILLLLIYSSFGHKEERFVHDVLVLYFIIISGILITAIQIVKSVFKKRMILFFLMTSYCFSQWQAMPDGKRPGVNQCLHFVSKQNDVRGLFLEHDFAFTFSYSLIHQNIPLLANLQKDFQEFDESSVISSNRSCFIQRDSCKASFVSLNAVSNVIHSSNSHGIIKYLLENYQKYNYAIISSSKDFFQPAYTKVYDTDSYSVWRFTDLDIHKRHLKRITQEMKSDASQHAIEEYEAERLKQMGKFWVALDRFRSAKKNAPNITRILASMAFCYQRIGLLRQASLTFTDCLKISDRGECARGAEARVLVGGSGKVV